MAEEAEQAAKANPKHPCHCITFCEQETSVSLILGDHEGESFIVILLTRDRKPGNSGNELKGALIAPNSIMCLY